MRFEQGAQREQTNAQRDSTVTREYSLVWIDLLESFAQAVTHKIHFVAEQIRFGGTDGRHNAIVVVVIVWSKGIRVASG
jgi:hypothetical protein